jgi:hypothetical protein
MSMSTSSSLRRYRSVTGPLLRAGLLMGWVMLGCGQGEGDRCEIDSDCNEGTCDVVNGNICRVTPILPTTNSGGSGGGGAGGVGGLAGSGGAASASGGAPGSDAAVDGKADAGDVASDVSADSAAVDGAHDH